MLTLAIEQSSVRGSVALLRDEDVIASRDWEVTWRQPQQLFAMLQAVLKQAGVVPSAIEAYAAGLGPGSFSGCRVAVSVARALALPGGVRVFGLSSGDALAFDLFAATGADTVAVAGDARRNHVWLGHFARGERWPVMTRPWTLQPVEQLSTELAGAAQVVSPDWDRLAPVLKHACPAGTKLVEETRLPVAGTLGLLAGRKIISGCETEPLAPIYLHPAVRPERKGA